MDDEAARIAGLLAPFCRAPLTAEVLARFQAYLELLLRWNARINLTALRSPEEIAARHFGESIFAAGQLLGPDDTFHVADVGSGAGFPGLPLAILRPHCRVTLIESHNKKAVFLKEAARACALSNVEVLAQRAEGVRRQFDLVTLRAVERFAKVLATAGALVKPGGRLGLLIGRSQLPAAQEVLPGWQWRPPALIPGSESRVVVAGTKPVD